MLKQQNTLTPILAYYVINSVINNYKNIDSEAWKLLSEQNVKQVNQKFVKVDKMKIGEVAFFPRRLAGLWRRMASNAKRDDFDKNARCLKLFICDGVATDEWISNY